MNLLLSLISFFVYLAASVFNPVAPRPQTARRVAAPSVKLQASTPSATVPPPQNPQSPQPSVPWVQPVNTVVPWGTTEKLGPGLYRTYVGQDNQMGSPEEILSALNNYRRDHNAGGVFSDDKLCRLAQTRAAYQDKLGSLDSHKGLNEYLNDPKHWEELEVTAVGENASYGYILSGVHLIEWVFDSDEEHRSNQLNPNWTLACPAISGVTVDIIFAKK